MTHVAVDGQFVNQKVAQVVAAIIDYCPDLSVEYIPEGVRLKGDAAYRIIHSPVGSPSYVVMHVKNDDEFDARVLKRIIAGDQRNGKVSMGEIEAAEEAAKRVAFQVWQDKRDEDIDKMFHVLKSPLNTYKLDKDTIIKDGIPFNAKGY